MLSPVCLVNNASTAGGKSLTAGATGQTVSLASVTDVQYWSFACTSTDESTSPAAVNASLVINGNAKTATFTAPASGSAAIFTSTVGSRALGRDANGTLVPAYTTTFKVYAGQEVLCANETNERHAVAGWASLVNPIVRGGASRASTVATLADLKAVTGQSLVGGPGVASVLGRTTQGDGFEGSFVWIPGTPPAADNGGTVFLPNAQPSTPGYWQRVYAGPLNVQWFLTSRNNDISGSKGDDAPGIRKAILALTNGGQLYFPTRVYYCNSAVNQAVLDFSDSTICNNVVHVRGDGFNCSTYDPQASNPYVGKYGGTCFILGPNVPSNADFIRRAGTTIVNGSTIEDLMVMPYTGVASAGVGRHGIHVDSVGRGAYYEQGFAVRRVYVGNMATGRSIKTSADYGSFGGAINNADIEFCQLMSVHLENCGDSVVVRRNSFGFNADASAHEVAVRYSNNGGVALFVVAENNIVNPDGMVVVDSGTNVVIRHNEFEQTLANINGATIDIAPGAGAVIGCVVEGNSISQNFGDPTTPIVPVRIGNATGTFVYGNRIETAGPPSGAVWTNPPHITIGASAVNTGIGVNQYRTAGVENQGTFVNASTTTNSQKVSAVGEALFSSDVATTSGILATNAYTASQHMPSQRWTHGTGASFLGATMWGHSSGYSSISSWEKWNTATTRWEAPYAATYGIARLAINDQMAGNVTVYTSASATRAAGDAVTETRSVLASDTGIRVLPDYAPASGGTTGKGIMFGSVSNLGIMFGSSAPTCSAAKGTLYSNILGNSTSTRLYVNTDGATGWTNLVTAA